MKITEKLNLDRAGLIEHGPITIVAFGDSVTHGAFGIDEIDYEAVYWSRLGRKINGIRRYVPVNVINAGIGGVTANGSLGRIDKQVLAHNPDLITVCFGLNDVCRAYPRALERSQYASRLCNGSRLSRN